MVLMGFGEKIILPVKDWFQKLTAVQKRRLVLICTAVFSLLLTLSVIISMVKKAEKSPAEHERITVISPIPAGELFLPDEPDFIPGVLPERERKTVWTEEDAAEFWQDPLTQDEEQWRDKIEAAIDEFLERVP